VLRGRHVVFLMNIVHSSALFAQLSLALVLSRSGACHELPPTRPCTPRAAAGLFGCNLMYSGARSFRIILPCVSLLSSLIALARYRLTLS
jgi:hypothetical protein